MTKAVFVNLRHNLAPQEGEGQIFLPNSVFTAGSRAIQAGADISFQDGNLRPLTLDAYDDVGVSVIGAPYIPEVSRQIPGREVIVGGQIINGLTRRSRADLQRLFGERCVNGNDDAELANAIGVQANDFPELLKTSVIPAYERLQPEDLTKYLRHELAFFLSQGCEKSCTFCAAQRTHRDPHTGAVRIVKEEYRDLEIVERDLRYLVEKAVAAGIPELRMYLSNLDLCQTPAMLSEFVGIAENIQRLHTGCRLRMRGLCTTDHFMHIARKFPALLRRMADVGIERLGFGVDGDPEDAELQRSNNKGYNVKHSENAIRTAAAHGITPETLMVFGHELDTEQSLRGAVRFAARMAHDYGAIPRPHISKDLIPGNDGWYNPANEERIEQRFADPQLFYNDDLTAEPSSLSHPDPEKRALVQRYVVLMERLPGSKTEVITATEPHTSEKERSLIQLVNQGKYDN